MVRVGLKHVLEHRPRIQAVVLGQKQLAQKDAWPLITGIGGDGLVVYPQRIPQKIRIAATQVGEPEGNGRQIVSREPFEPAERLVARAAIIQQHGLTQLRTQSIGGAAANSSPVRRRCPFQVAALDQNVTQDALQLRGTGMLRHGSARRFLRLLVPADGGQAAHQPAIGHRVRLSLPDKPAKGRRRLLVTPCAERDLRLAHAHAGVLPCRRLSRGGAHRR